MKLMSGKPVVIVSGLSGSGKSNLVERIAAAFNLKCVHTSGLLQRLREKGKVELSAASSPKNLGWWESEEGKRFTEQRERDTSLDELLDRELLKLIEKGNVAMDSWTMGYLSKKGFKIWLEGSEGVRAERIAKRNKQEVREVLAAIREKEERTARIYKRLYGFELGKGLEKFNLVIETDNLSEREVQEKALKAVKKYVEGL